MMCDLLVLLITSFSIIAAQDVAAGCSLCGPGLEVGNPDAIFVFPDNQGSVVTTCGDLEDDVASQATPPYICDILPGLYTDVCGCRLAAPTNVNPDPPTVGVPTDGVPAACNMCREPGYTIQNPYGSMSVPGYPNGFDHVTVFSQCYRIEQYAAAGEFDEVQCAMLPALVDESCGGCIPGAPTLRAPIAPFATSPSPSVPIVDVLPSSNSSSNGGKIYGQSYFWFLVFGLGTLACCSVCVCFFRTKTPETQEYGIAMGRRTTTTDTSNNVQRNNNEEELAAARLEAKVRPLVLQTLFPEQKGSITDVDGSLELEDGEATNEVKEQASCSICLETLDLKDSVVVGSSCSHVYHRDCIIQWLSKKVSTDNNQYHDDCPNCRRRMWDPATYQLVKETIICQEAQEQALSIPDAVVDDQQDEEEV